MSNELAVGMIGVLVVLAQAVPIMWMMNREKKRDKKDEVVIQSNNPAPGSGERCMNHHREIGELKQCVIAIKKMRGEDLEDQKDFRKKVERHIGKIFDRIDELVKMVK